MLAQRAVADSPRWTRAVEDQSAPIPEEKINKLGRTIGRFPRRPQSKTPHVIAHNYHSQILVNTSISARWPLILPSERIEQTILLIRRHRVMLDMDLAKLYGVSAKVLNQAVRRNASRFPTDFMFQLTGEEATVLRSQIATLKPGRGQHRKYRPYAFTEQGVAMLSSVLHKVKRIGFKT